MKFMRTSSTGPDRSAGRRGLADTFLRILSRRRALIGAQAGALLSVLVLASTFSPGAPLLTVWLIWIVFVPIFPLHVRSVLILREGGFPRASGASPRCPCSVCGPGPRIVRSRHVFDRYRGWRARETRRQLLPAQPHRANSCLTRDLPTCDRSQPADFRRDSGHLLPSRCPRKSRAEDSCKQCARARCARVTLGITGPRDRTLSEALCVVG